MGVANSTIFPGCTREVPHQLVLIACCTMSPRILRKFCDLNFAKLPASIQRCHWPRRPVDTNVAKGVVRCIGRTPPLLSTDTLAC
jgi:hypothetical protein